jgi:protein transport protein DSL1/ZW10
MDIINLFPQIGLANLRSAERVQKKMVPRDEGMQITATGNTVNDEWDAAWDSDKEDYSPVEKNPSEMPHTERISEGSSERNRHSLDEERKHSSLSSVSALAPDEDDDPTDAWGWNDDDATEEAVVDPEESKPATTRDASALIQQKSGPELRQVTVSEKFQMSSIPQPILQAVIGVLNDGATLTQPKFVPIPLPVNATN